MFESIVVVIIAVALLPPLYLWKQVSVLKRKVDRTLEFAAVPEEYRQAELGVQRELVQSFDVFDSLLASLQYSREALSGTARAFISTFRERAAAYLERGGEGSLLCTQVRDDRLKQLAVELLLQHREDIARHEAVNPDGLDNGDFSEYLKLLKYLVHRHLLHIGGAKGGRCNTSFGPLRPAAV